MTGDTGSLYIPDDMDCRTCNMCVNHCPTFKISREQAESPRGRLKLMSKVLYDGEVLSEDETTHLNNCVECRACEKVCPSKMRYFKLLRKTRDKLPKPAQPTSVKALLYATSHRSTLLRVFNTLRIYQRSGLQVMAEKLGLLKLTRTDKLNKLLPKLTEYRELNKHYPSIGEHKGSVGLFTGCLTKAMDNPTLHAAVKVLTYMGYDVHIPQQQQCCGVIHSHNDDKKTADEMAEINLRAFQNLDLDAIVFTASACGSPLKQYKRRKVSAEIENEIERFSGLIKEVSEFISEQEWPEELTLNALNKKISVHEPCSHQYPLGSSKSPYKLLEKIPGITLESLPENNICCGAGGTYMLTHPEQSQEIRDAKLEHIRKAETDIVVTSNIGCALNLATGCAQNKLNVAVTHPVEVLAQQLPDNQATL